MLVESETMASACHIKLTYERRVHDLLEAHEVPVPHVYGYCSDPYAMVMDRLPGSVDLSFAASDQERADLVLEYLSFLPAFRN